MGDGFEVFEPKKFFDVFVLRAYREHLQAPTDYYHVKTAVHHCNVLAERVWKFYGAIDLKLVAGAPKAGVYRKFLVGKECSDFQLVWDIDDGQKHVELSRPNRLVSSAAQTGLRSQGGALGSMALGEASLGGDTSLILVRLDDGSERAITSVLTNVVEMWERVLSKL